MSPKPKGRVQAKDRRTHRQGSDAGPPDRSISGVKPGILVVIEAVPST
jgi:hypothetical protein